MKGALFGPRGRLVSRRSIGSFEERGDALASLTALIRHLLDRADGGDTRVGIATPGLVDSATGSIEYAANLGWRSLALRDELESGFGVPVSVDHDARAAAGAELVAQRARRGPLDDFVFVPIGTGVSAAVVAAGRVVPGAFGAAGEIGHMIAVPGGAVCACGQRGCVEAYASASGIARRYRINGGDADLSSADIVTRIGSDPIARRTWDEAVDALGAGLASVIAVLDPALVVIGGGLAGAGSALVDPLRVAVGRDLLWRTVPPIEQTLIGPEAGLIGAALLVTPAEDQQEFVRSARTALEAAGVGA